MQNTMRSIYHQLGKGRLARLIASYQRYSIREYSRSKMCCFHSKELHCFSSSSEQTAFIDSNATSSTEITIEDFAKVNLLIGTIKHVEMVPKSSKLLKIMVDLGESIGTRQILSGVRKFYSSEEAIQNYLLNKQCIVIENLKPRQMAGHTSHGMILFATATDANGNPSITLVNPCNLQNQCNDPSIVQDGTRVM